MASASLSAEARTETGKGVARKLRAAGRVPAVVYGHAREAQALSLQTRELEKLLSSISTGSTVVELTLGGATTKTLIREVQRHPFKKQILHVDFQELVAGEKVTVEIPLVFVGIPEGVRSAARCSSRSCTASKCSSIRRTSRTTSTSTSPTWPWVTRCTSTSSSLPPVSRSDGRGRDGVRRRRAARRRRGDAGRGREAVAEPELIRKPKEEEEAK
jgi:ribosomal protein bL25 (Ctc-form)